MPARSTAARSRRPSIAPASYAFHTAPRAHQRAVFDRAKDLAYFALLMEQGTGKTKVDIDCSAYSYEAGLIDAWAIVAPAGVHLNWTRQELPKHLPPRLTGAAFLAWDSSRARTKSFQRDLASVLAAPFPIVSFNAEALLTDPGLDALRALLRGRRCKLTIDESSLIKNVKAQRTTLLLKAGKLAVQRRILNGTPVTNGPLNLYSQMLFLDEDILGFSSYYTFAHHYAEWTKKRNWSQGRDYEELVAYKHLDELVAKIAPVSFRVTKAECLDLPPAIELPPRYYELTPEQRAIYEALRDEFLVELGGRTITAALALTRLLRLQQVCCGYLPGAEAGEMYPIPGPNRRIETLLTQVSETEPRKAIIWCRFREDVRRVAASLREEYGINVVVTYDGSTGQDARDTAKRQFQAPKSLVRFFVGNPAAGGRGLDLYAAEHVYRYSSSFSLEQRLQADARAHRDGLTHPVSYSDLVALGTVDEHIAATLAAGKDVAEGIVGALPRWLK